MKRLSGEIVELKQHLEHYDKVQELTQMLQEGHRCLRGGRGRGRASPGHIMGHRGARECHGRWGSGPRVSLH